MKKILKAVANRLGHDIMHLPTDPIARQWLDLMRANQINVLFDVGANAGQFGKRVRALGYAGELVSFEPLADAYELLLAAALGDPHWKTVNTALGNRQDTAEINVSGNSYSSSLLEILPRHLESAANAAYIRRETIRICPLDELIDQYAGPDAQLYVKIDTQGYERQVLEGCARSLGRIKGFQLELSLQPLYEDETPMHEMIALLGEAGYKLKLIEGGHRNYETGELLQVEGYFFR